MRGKVRCCVKQEGEMHVETRRGGGECRAEGR